MFDINFNPEKSDGGLDEEAARLYIEQLTEFFRKSAEGQQIISQQEQIQWAAMFMEYGFDFLGILPPEMLHDDVEEIIFSIFPEKVSTPASEAQNIIKELKGFWQFLEREYQLPNATEILKLFTDQAIEELTEELANPANYGMAKSMVMEGIAKGYDFTDETQVNRWMNEYNQNLSNLASVPEPFFSNEFNMPSLLKPYTVAIGAEKKAAKAKKAKRKMKQASQKKNRKRK